MMSKGYWISCYRSPADPEVIERYSRIAGPILAAAGGRILTVGKPEAVFEDGKPERTVIIEFESPERARETFESDAYQEAARIVNAHAIRDVRIARGL